jgi:membrane-associated protease RseP (regulator of RpoE activity)
LLNCLAFAQDQPRAEVYGGYSYVNIDTNGVTDRQSANGWEAAVSVNFNKWAAVEGDVAGYYKNNVLGTGINASDYTFTAGPRINFRPVFVHALFGGDRLSGSQSGISVSQNSFAMALGGGAQFKVAPRWAVRASVDYLRTHHNGASFGGPDLSQNNVRVGGGIVYLIGSRGHHHEAAAEKTAEKQGCGTFAENPRPVTLAEVGITGQGGSVYGFRVTAVAPDSPAANARIAAGDIIVTVNCVKVLTADELTQTLSRVTGAAELTITRPEWMASQTEPRQLVIGK